jgi:hypothetical protein
MLGGSELNTVKSRAEFGIKTKFRLIDGGFGKYGDIISIENEEMVLGTSTMSKDEILYFRPLHFLIQFLWNYGYYKEPLLFLKSEGFNPVDVMVSMIERRAEAPLSVKTVLDDFIKESYGEWFDSIEEIFKLYAIPANFENLKKGGFGKLNYKYTYKILLECKGDFDEYLYSVLQNMIDVKGVKIPFAKEQMKDLFNYTHNAFVDFRDFFNDNVKDRIVKFDYDILKWKEQHNQKPLKTFKTSGVELRFTLPKDQAQALQALSSRFRGADFNQTLRKMSEYVNEKDLFNKVGYA